LRFAKVKKLYGVRFDRAAEIYWPQVVFTRNKQRLIYDFFKAICILKSQGRIHEVNRQDITAIYEAYDSDASLEKVVHMLRRCRLISHENYYYSIQESTYLNLSRIDDVGREMGTTKNLIVELITGRSTVKAPMRKELE
jgi:hypothetical protein